MTKKSLPALVLISSLSGCQAAPLEPMQTGTQKQALVCDTNSGAYPVLASLAVALALETGRIQPLTDLVARNANGTALSGNWGSAVEVELSATALGRCELRGVPGCPLSWDLLSLQNEGQTAYIDLDWDSFDATNYFWALVAGFDRQATHENDLRMNAPELLAGEHEVFFLQSSDFGACGMHTEFKAYGENVSRLDSKLAFYGGDSNPYLDFRSSESVIAIDPDPYLTNGASNVNDNLCYATCRVSTPAYLGKCCTCENKIGNFVRLRPKTFVCK